mgnify:CR=1 FL=1
MKRLTGLADMNIKNRVFWFEVLVISFTSSLLSITTYAEEYFSINDGQLDRPANYREWVYVGTPVTPNDMNDGKAAFPEHFHE